MKYLNFIRRIVLLPFKAFVFPLWLVIGFLDTDWEDEESRRLFIKMMRKIKP